MVPARSCLGEKLGARIFLPPDQFDEHQGAVSVLAQTIQEQLPGTVRGPCASAARANTTRKHRAAPRVQKPPACQAAVSPFRSPPWRRAHTQKTGQVPRRQKEEKASGRRRKKTRHRAAMAIPVIADGLEPGLLDGAAAPPENAPCGANSRDTKQDHQHGEAANQSAVYKVPPPRRSPEPPEQNAQHTFAEGASAERRYGPGSRSRHALESTRREGGCARSECFRAGRTSGAVVRKPAQPFGHETKIRNSRCQQQEGEVGQPVLTRDLLPLCVRITKIGRPSKAAGKQAVANGPA